MENKKALWTLVLDKFVFASFLAFIGFYFNDKLNEKEKQAQLNLSYKEEQLQKELQENDIQLQKFLNKKDAEIQKELQDQRTKAEENLIKIQNKFQQEDIKRQQQFSKEIEHIKSIYSFTNDVEKIKLERKINHLQKQLEEFYYPLSIRLKQDDLTWKLRSEKWIKEEYRAKGFASNMDTAVVLANHLEVVKILENKSYLMGPNPQLRELFSAYLKHVKVYYALRKAGIKGDPQKIASTQYEYPNEISNQVNNETERLQVIYDTLLKEYQNKVLTLTINPDSHMLDKPEHTAPPKPENLKWDFQAAL